VTPENPPRDVEEPLSPEDAEAVRRLLVAAGGPDAVPEDVAARLDEVLAGLQAEREGTTDAPVAELAARRRRRWPTVLVAAAAVGVVGVGIGNVMENTGGAGDAPTSDQVSAPEAGGAESAPEQGARALTKDQADDQAVPLPRIRARSATLDAQRILDLGLRAAAGQLTDPEAAERSALPTGCDLPSPARGEKLVAVRFDGERASLLFRAPTNGEREAQIYSCDDSHTPVLVTTVVAR
jgi:hypothetical protein